MPLDDALAHSHTAVVNFLRSYMGSGLNGSRYIRELCYGAAEGDEDLVMRSLHNGIDPNATLYDMRTPLHIAAGKGHLKVLSPQLLRPTHLSEFNPEWMEAQAPSVRNC